MTRTASRAIAMLSTVAAAVAAASVAHADVPIRMTSDFFVTYEAPSSHALPLPGSRPDRLDRATCEDQLTRATCSTGATDAQIGQGWTQVPCDADSASFVPTLMRIHDELPERLRPSLCSLSRIFISDGISSVAFASAVRAGLGQPPRAAYMGFRKATFLHSPSTHDLVSWKEQLLFGGSSQFLANDPSLVQLHYDLKLAHLDTDGLFYVFVHELGHLIDFNNSITAQGPWTGMSWTTGGRIPKRTTGFWQQDKICFYNCFGTAKLAPDTAWRMYESLSHSAFLTTYSGTNNLEDFAEFWAWYVARNLKHADYRIEVPGAGTLDMNPVFTDNLVVAAKLKYIDQLWNSSTLRVVNGLPQSRDWAAPSCAL